MADDQVDAAVEHIKSGMINAVELSVPLDINIAFADNWLDAK